MYRFFVLRNNKGVCFGGYALISVWALLLCSGIGALAQSSAPPLNANESFSIRATHLLGFAESDKLRRGFSGSFSGPGPCIQVTSNSSSPESDGT
jgi:hypothetical protein